ncbi:putative cyclohexanone monooxygenase [Aspergillus clavatus NRRL 1]|uniref:Ketocytochalasin monooxygenase n=2 Tax=Aspergillus clavatus TaxID=5057 RepID=CCSB_ASPCL|nr:cyclohexanone monooxygenase, putative [Aspergillus clavatus NRRL 1]A1CLY7.1 RecName: Full=Ketocytochalasin monooxygenase; AltName: Full=Carbonate-forming Baeyer-Villiger monooxygenase; Short=BVMO; AltName: Full=Cytochalasin biosynthesis protein B [Aspergillus clavatus NRRL 1]AIE17460.1 CcsB [Aspergillus clavatus]EAW09116.1 cyclohexanone monooxygenase, putative [Aspergillus clavatus NRRL 1]
MGSLLSIVLRSATRIIRPIIPSSVLSLLSGPKPVHPLQTLQFDKEAILEKYQAERAKRLRQDGVSQFKSARSGAYDRFRQDVARPQSREPIEAETKVLIVGAGFAGLVAAVKLDQQGVQDFRIVDKAAGFGGTWYWNQYPGAACDVESLIYLPFLEETGYIPSRRFCYGPEIREQVNRVVAKWDLARRSHLSTEITSMTWDESILRWHVKTNHGDHFITQFVVMATGTFHEPKLPGIPGIENFKGDHFHSGRWDYRITGGDETGNMSQLANKTVGIIGTGASAVQLVPKLARDAKKLYVFQRTPSSIRFRDNSLYDTPSLKKSLPPGWQRQRMTDFANILTGQVVDQDCDALEGLQELTMRAILKEASDAGVTVQPEQIPELMQLADFRLMQQIRGQVDEIVKDQETAAKLKPWYSFMCKRPTFHNDYLAAFNNPNVELVDTDGQGVSYLTETAVVANGREYEVDLLVYSTGFDFDVEANFYRRTGIQLVGSRGRTFDEKWDEKGPSTLFGVHIREFPNLLYVGPAQTGVTANWTHTTYAVGDHIAEFVAKSLRDGQYQAFEPTEEAEEEWGRRNEEGSEMRLLFAQSCPPGYYNREGKPEEIPARWAYFPKGIIEWTRITQEWREKGDYQGMDKR